MSIIASVVTVPDRLESFLSVLDELSLSTVTPDYLYISIAKYYPRLGKEFPSNGVEMIAEKLKSLKMDSRIIIYDKDLGPCLKLITPLIEHDMKEGDSVVIFDDDSGLFPTAIQCFLECKEKHGTASYGAMGTKEGRWVHGEFLYTDFLEVDLLGGYRGVIYPYEVISDLHEWMIPILSKFDELGKIAVHDDHIFNSYLKEKGISRRVCKVYPTESPDGFLNYWVSEGESQFRGYINYNPRHNDNGIVQDSNSEESMQILNSMLQ